MFIPIPPEKTSAPLRHFVAGDCAVPKENVYRQIGQSQVVKREWVRPINR
jgi:hypothetical protein